MEQLFFWRGFSGTGVPSDVARTLEGHFGVPPEAIGRLQCYQKRGTYVRQPVRYIRVFDPSRAGDGARPARKYDDLDKQHDAVLFEGHGDKAGFIYLIDRRATVGFEVPATAATVRS